MSEAGTAASPGEADEGESSARTRRLSGAWKGLLLAWTTAVIALCFNQQFTLRFFADVTLLDTEYFWALLALLLPLAFVIYPARAGRVLEGVP